MESLDSIFLRSNSNREFATKYLKYLSNLISRIDPEPIAKFIDLLNQSRIKGNQIFFFGNGGSAATASHFANDICAGPNCWDNPYRAISLTDNVALMTAIANDHGYEKVFLLQLKALLKPADLVVGISASGNSANVLNAIDYANKNGAKTIGLTGFDGGQLAKLAHINIHVPTEKGEYGPVEDIHMIVDHLVGSYLRKTNSNNLKQVAV